MWRTPTGHSTASTRRREYSLFHSPQPMAWSCSSRSRWSGPASQPGASASGTSSGGRSVKLCQPVQHSSCPAFAPAASRARCSGASRSSASINAKYCPPAARMPVSRAAAGPAFFWRRSRNRPSSSQTRLHSCAESSVEPSSTSSTSNASKLCRRMQASASSSQAPALYTGTTRLISGACPAAADSRFIEQTSSPPVPARSFPRRGIGIGRLIKLL